MKIALIIFPIHPSHGCILQTFALQQVLKHEGHEITIIDRKWDHPGLISVCKEWTKIITGLICGEKKHPRAHTQRFLMSELDPFIQANLPNRRIYHKNPTYDELSDFDAFIVGSDQTWRPKYVSDIKYYYLSFVPEDANVKRIAYAPSFGTEEWEYSPELTATCKELINRFDAVSVREESGVFLCKEYYGIDARHVLDPTMLLTRVDYLSACNLDLHEDNVLSYYLLDNSESKMAVVSKVCSELNLQCNRINTETENGNAPLSERVAPSIEKWIGGFAHSKFIVADSFHATVFAIIFNRPFITIANPERGLSRFESLLAEFGLQDRMVFSVNEISEKLLKTPIDWHNVNRIMYNEQNKSKEFIMNNLKDSKIAKRSDRGLRI